MGTEPPHGGDNLRTPLTSKVLTALAAAFAFSWVTLSHTQAEQLEVPVTIIGGSAAAGWHDATQQGYIVRAVKHIGTTNDIRFEIANHAVPGARVTNPHVEASFPDWMKTTEGSVLVIAWGYLNDLRLKTPTSTVLGHVHAEIRQALATNHLVLLVSPPATTPTFTFDKGPERRLWDRVVQTAHAFHSSNVYVLNVLNPMTHYITRHHQHVTQYMDGLWDPNTAGHILASRILTQQLLAGAGRRFNIFHQPWARPSRLW